MFAAAAGKKPRKKGGRTDGKGSPLLAAEGAESETPADESSCQSLRRSAHDLFENPESGPCAFWLSVFVALCVIVSVVTFVLESVPSFDTNIHPEWHDRWGALECFVITIFSVDYVVRLLANDVGLCSFLLKPANVVDFTSILPFYADRLGEILNKGNHGQHVNLSWLRVLRLGRLFRIFKVSKYLSSMEVLFTAFSNSVEALLLMVFFMAVTMVIFSGLMWSVERGQWNEKSECYVLAGQSKCSQFESVPAAFYWAVTTLTTVGYGDMVPQTNGGKFIAGIAMVSGILALAMPVTVLSNNFHEAWQANLHRKKDIQVRRALAGDGSSAEKALFAENERLQHTLAELAECTPRLRVLLLGELTGAKHDALEAAFNATEQSLLTAATNFSHFIEHVEELRAHTRGLQHARTEPLP